LELTVDEKKKRKKERVWVEGTLPMC